MPNREALSRHVSGSANRQASQKGLAFSFAALSLPLAWTSKRALHVASTKHGGSIRVPLPKCLTYGPIICQMKYGSKSRVAPQSVAHMVQPKDNRVASRKRLKHNPPQAQLQNSFPSKVSGIRAIGSASMSPGIAPQRKLFAGTNKIHIMSLDGGSQKCFTACVSALLMGRPTKVPGRLSPVG